MAEQALSDVKVLDLTWYIAGPYCTKMFVAFAAIIALRYRRRTGRG